MEKLAEKYIFPLNMPAFILPQGKPVEPTFVNHKIVEATVWEHDHYISISHPSFKFKGTMLYAQYLVDERMWYHHDEHAVLILHCFAQIIKKNHGEFEVCCHKDSEKWKDLHHQSMADITDHRECLLHMIDRLGLWDGVFGK